MTDPFTQFIRDAGDETKLIEAIHRFGRGTGTHIDPASLTVENDPRLEWQLQERGEFASVHDVPPELPHPGPGETTDYHALQRIIRDGVFHRVELAAPLEGKGDVLVRSHHRTIKNQLLAEIDKGFDIDGSKLTAIALASYLFGEVYKPLEAQALGLQKMAVKSQRTGKER